MEKPVVWWAIFYCFFQNGKTRYLVSNFLLLFPEWKNLLFGERFLLLFPKWKNPLFLLFSSSIYSKLCFLLCRVLGVKLKDNAQSYKCKNYYGKKVWTVNAADVEWVECEHVNKSNVMTQLESQIKNWKMNWICHQKITNQTSKQSNPKLMSWTRNWQNFFDSRCAINSG